MLKSLSRRWLRPELGIGAVALLGLSFLVLPFLPVPDPPLAGWGAFLGRFHPLVVHFPIVLVVIPLLLEGAARIGRQDAFFKLIPLFWGLAALSCMVAVLAGYLLYISGEYGGSLIRDHLWAGIILVLLVLFTGTLSLVPRVRRSTPWLAVYLAGAVLTNAVVVYAGHLGGSLTHGEGFVMNAFPGWGYQPTVLESSAREDLLVFRDIIMPGFETRCISCHNPQRAKGSLDMTSHSAMLRGGDSGRKLFFPSHPDSSELYRRITLPPGHNDRMPPEGRPSLTSDEVAILSWWIEEGADPEMRLGAGPDDLMTQNLLERYLPRLIVQQRRRMRERERIATLQRRLQDEIHELGLMIDVDPESDSTLFALSMRVPPYRVDDRTIAELEPHAELFSKLSLVSSDVTDEGLRHIARMENLRELILQKTRVTGAGIPHLQSLPALEVLNLAHSALSDSGAVHLLRMPSLREVYVYNTFVSDSLLEGLRLHLPDTEVSRTEGPTY